MFKRLNELADLAKEFHIEVNKAIADIKTNYPVIYKRQKGIRVEYTYQKYDTKYLQFDYDAYGFCIIFSSDKGVGFPLNKYRKTWGFSKEDFE